jgi:DNA-binding HxlR family transcriptional regulator
VAVRSARSRVQGSVQGAKVRITAPEPQVTRLDRLIHDRVRLGILSALASATPMSFGDLKSSLDVTDGNLSVHARKLEEAGYIVCKKTFSGRTPRTDYAMTPAGRRAFEKYLEHMEAIIDATRKSKA